MRGEPPWKRWPLEMPDTVALICRLPIDFHSARTKSLLQLISESGYTKGSDTVTESSTETLLDDHLEWCGDWIGFSQDRRTSSGWVISERADGFDVYFYPSGSTLLSFNDKAAACAAFSIRELKSLTSGDV